MTTLLSQKMKPVEKLELLEKEYEIPVESAKREEIFRMCNLSEGIVEETTAKVTAQVTTQVTAQVTTEIMMNMHDKGYTTEQIADAMNKSVSEVEKIIREEELSPAK